MKPLNPKHVEHSQARLPALEAWAASEPLQQDLFKPKNDERLFRLLNNSDSPAFHHGYATGAGTLHTIVCSPKDRTILVGIGGDAQPVKLDINSWSKGTNLPVHVIEGQLGGTQRPYDPKSRASSAKTKGEGKH